MSSKITEVTRQDIIDLLTFGYHDEGTGEDIHCFWNGKLDEPVFLSRLYNLKSMPSTDGRYEDAYGDIHQHRVNNSDWENDWVFYDSRFSIKTVQDEEWLKFISESFHPSVRDERCDWKVILDKINSLLKIDGYELYENEHISGRPKFSPRKTNIKSITANTPKQQNSYELKLIGEGSYAQIFKYKDSFYNRFFVVKRAKKDLNTKEIERFKREFEEMKSLRSPYVVEVFQYSNDSNEYIMEYMDNSLYNYIQQNNSKLTNVQRKNICLQILKAFEYIHSKSLLHRDISPNNVLVKDYEDILVIKVSDFGLVKIPDSELTSTNTEYKGWFNDPGLRIHGFNTYNMGHEIYAITNLIYFVLTGKISPNKIVNENLKKFVENGMNPNKKDRYKNIAEIKQALKSISLLDL